ncbi:MAG TPA: glycosyltransferase [Casimicrobiaceae bacterium]|nr:glycosyltransferase [Casimicrobiaceae bacterium]
MAAVDIVIPVYNAADDLARCLESVLEHASGDWRLIVIDDASTDPAIGDCFAALRARRLSQVSLLENPSNVGFTLTANRGIAEARPGADVVLLNSDTVVTRGWLDKLSRCAASDPRIGTITPFSNNAEICSLPRFCVNNAWIPGHDPESLLRALEDAAVPTYPNLPTGVGFCLYVRRALLEAIGHFDPVFGLGYGEENDLCLRAAAAGYRNVLCEDAFVLHLGGSSFGEKRTSLAERNTALLLERHPEYMELVRDYIAADPLRPLRELALSLQRAEQGPPHGILHLLHGHGGGTEYHVRALIAASSETFRHYLLIAVGESWRLEEYAAGELVAYDFQRAPGETWRDYLGGIASRFRIDLVHLHNISGCREGLQAALVDLGIPYGYTVHDLNFACPTITFLDPAGRYCGGVTDAVRCRDCLSEQRDFAHVDIDAWRSAHRTLLASASFSIAPSHWAAAMLRRYFPGHALSVIEHGSANGAAREDAVYSRVALPDDGVPTVAVVGAIGADKGARRLERLVELTRQRGAKLRWVLIGYLDRGREQMRTPDALFTQHGPFDSREIGALLDHYRVRLVAYPSAGPETFSFTLSEAWAAGRPVVVPPIGALAERVGASGGGWVLTEAEWADDARMLDRIAGLLAAENAEAWTAAAGRAAGAHQPTLAAMAEATVGVWKRALGHARPSLAAQPISAARCLSALHYVAWTPPAARESDAQKLDGSSVPAAKPNGALTYVARAALSIRHTFAGRVLHRLAPKPLLDALRQRL